ncbi:SRPBCC domain-containing protein [Massilia sp. METH4]|uniref:SRPBCC domain-containing protein n=1 Tax=Massilia sp. METH4 TaxID=3123041 RepID=UPI0030D45A2C
MANADEVGLTIRRVFDAPRELVFTTMTDPDHLRHWWGPKECTITVARAEARPGGAFHYCMHPREGMPGMEVWGRFDFHEIARPHRFVFVNGFADEQGNRIRYPLLPVWPLEVLNTVTLEEDNGKTIFTLHSVPVNASDAECAAFRAGHESMQQGFGGMYDLYEQYLATANTADREIVITRTLRAPRERVFDAFTDPRQISVWWGPNGYSVATASMDARAGGSWRFEMTGPDGTLWPNLVEYQEVTRPERLVYHHGSGSEGDPGFDVRITFEEAGDAETLLTMRTIFASPEALAAVKKFGAEELGRQTIGKLAEYLEHAA